MAAPKYPTVNVPPKKTKTVSKTGAFNGFINAHPTMRPYADTVAKWANAYGVDPTVMAALFWRESFAEATAQNADPATITSPTGAGVGIGQINPIHVGEQLPWGGGKVTQSDLTNAEFNIRWSTWYFSNALSRYGNIDDAYSKGYNPGYTGMPLSKLLPASYVPSSTLSPGQKASVGAQGAAARNTINDPWVVLTKAGKIAYVNAPAPPPNVLTYGGAPVSENGLWQGSASFNTEWKATGRYADQYLAFTGKPATPKEIAKILAQAPSIYTLQTQLASRPTFFSSPAWKANAPGLIGDAQKILGNGWTGDSPAAKKMLAEAISENWSQGTWEQNIRTLPEYTKGPEFKQNAASMTDAFEQTFGSEPDATVKQLITDRTKAGWTPDQFQKWLMTQPAYKQSPSYQAKVQTFLTQMGLITGAVPTLSKDQVEQMLKSGDSLEPPVAPGAGPAPGTAPGATPQTPVDKPTGVGPTGYNAPFTPTTMISGEKKNEGPFTRRVV